MINWKVRLKNKTFWITIVPAIALVVHTIASVFDIYIDTETLSGKIVAAIEAVFALLAILGIIVDPTTAGIKDSERAMNYTEPWQDEPKELKESEQDQELKNDDK